MQTRQLVRNSIQTPDGTILESHSVHNYVTYVDKNGKVYMIDGGLVYFRRSNNGDEIDLCVYLDEPFEKVREAFKRGTMGIDGTEPLHYIRLCDMTEDHLLATIKYFEDNEIKITDDLSLSSIYRFELEYRKENK